jgi:hypothetical protein
VAEEHILAHHPGEEPMNRHTDTHPATAPTALATNPHRRRRTTLAALGMATFLTFGAGVGVAALVDNDGPGPVAHPAPVTATVTSIIDADTLWSYLAQLPTDERDYILVALTQNPTGALRAIVAGMLAAAG